MWLWHIFFCFRFEVGISTVSCNIFNSKTGATRFGVENPCLPCKPLFGRPESLKNVQLQSTLQFWANQIRKVLKTFRFIIHFGLPERCVHTLQDFLNQSWERRFWCQDYLTRPWENLSQIESGKTFAKATRAKRGRA